MALPTIDRRDGFTYVEIEAGDFHYITVRHPRKRIGDQSTSPAELSWSGYGVTIEFADRFRIALAKACDVARELNDEFGVDVVAEAQEPI